VKTDYQMRQATNRRMRLLAVIDQELDRATARFDRFHSPHEGWAVIKEEMDELWKHVTENTGRSEAAMMEAVQTATMALRYVYDLGVDVPLPHEEEALRDYVERFKRVSS
jgi:hypothetical protein